MVQEKKLYKCSICGFHYKDKQMAKECHEYCSAHKSCSMEITKHSVELSQAKG